MDLERELNKKQYEAVVSNSQYLRIIAGAGSGKTRVLTYRIAHLIRDLNVYPSSILAITFTNKVAKEMKDRALNLIGDADRRDLNIFTFHAFCSRFLRCEIEILGFPRNFLIFDDEDQEKLIKDLAESKGLKRNDKVVAEVINYIGYHKMIGELPDDIKLDIRYPKDKIYLEYFREYEAKKNSMFCLDFDDLIIYTVRILKHFPEVKEKYNRRYKHILIDEFQDTNNLQYELVRLLMSENTSLYVVGDPDQTIYTWRGADQKIILDIEKHFVPMETIILNQNYRSTKQILDASNNLIKRNKKRIDKSLVTDRSSTDEVELNRFPNAIAEGRFVANKINELKLKHSDFKFHDVTVLYRSNYLSRTVEKSLKNTRIPYRIYGGVGFYQRTEVKDCLAYFRLFVNPDDDVSFERIINVPRRKIGDLTINQLKIEAKNANLSMIKYLKEIHRHETSLKSNAINSLETLFIKMDEVDAKLRDNQEAYSEVLFNFISEIGYFEYLKNEYEDNSDERIDNVNSLFDDIREYLKEDPESTFNDYLINASLYSAQDEIKDEDTVSLMTVHTAKGLEFKYVFVIGLAQDIFPNKRAVEERASDGMEEERRLCYVAFTRAKDKLFISYDGDYNYTTGTNNLPSQFISEANIKSKNNYSGFGNSYINDVQRKYKFDFNYDNKKETNVLTNRPNIIDLNKKNSIKWVVGDTCLHTFFGEGKVIAVRGDIIDVDFVSFGKKTLMGTHSALSKKE